jgi:predicted dehydrogenase
MEPVRILASAISGYGYYYLKTLFDEIPEARATLVGVIDPTPERSDYYPKILSRGIPVYSDIREFFLEGHQADLTVISSPIHYHVEQAAMALKFGSNVLVDKPLSGSIKEADELIAVKNETGLFVEVGYQWSFSTAIRELKEDILAGDFGKPLRMKTICLWPRDYAYYTRNHWAGKILSADGRPVNDSPANNACAHFVHNMFFLLGSSMDRSAGPAEVRGYRYRAYDIENYDTVEIGILADTGAELCFYSSHATEHARNPEFVLECEEARIEMNPESQGIRAEWKDGRVRNYGLPDADHQFKKLFDSIRLVREPGSPVCPPESAISQTITIAELQRSPAGIANFPESSIVFETSRRYVPGLGEKIGQHYDNWQIASLTPML